MDLSAGGCFIPAVHKLKPSLQPTPPAMWDPPQPVAREQGHQSWATRNLALLHSNTLMLRVKLRAWGDASHCNVLCEANGLTYL